MLFTSKDLVQTKTKITHRQPLSIPACRQHVLRSTAVQSSPVRPSAFSISAYNMQQQCCTALLSACIILLSPLSANAATSVIQGPARITDGDTLVIGDQRIRLYGVDAPESKQTCKDARGNSYFCGLTSKQALIDKVASQAVRCEVKNMDQYGRYVAACSVPGVGGNTDLGAHMAETGMAVAYRQYSKEYVPLEDVAHSAGKGIWQGSFEMPAEWRKQSKASSTASTPSVATLATMTPLPQKLIPTSTTQLPSIPTLPQQTCSSTAQAIKGNIGKGGDKVYHVPGGQYYDSVKIDTSKGERMFCSEEEAVKAGWHAAKK